MREKIIILIHILIIIILIIPSNSTILFSSQNIISQHIANRFIEFSTIIDRIDSAKEGDTVTISPGDYILDNKTLESDPQGLGRLFINKSVNIVAEIPGTISLKNGVGFDSNSIVLNTHDFRICGIELIDIYISIGFENHTVKNIEIVEMMFQGYNSNIFYEKGIHIDNGENITISNNIFNFGGITNSNNFKSSIINGNKFNDTGISLSSCSDIQIMENSFQKAEYGISIGESADIEMKSNSFYKTDVGIFMESKDENNIEENNFTNCRYGVFIGPKTKKTDIKNNKFFSNEVGIFLTDDFKNEYKEENIFINNTKNVEIDRIDNNNGIKGLLDFVLNPSPQKILCLSICTSILLIILIIMIFLLIRFRNRKMENTSKKEKEKKK